MQRELVWVLSFFRRRWGLILCVLARADTAALCIGFEVVFLGKVVCDRGETRKKSCHGMKRLLREARDNRFTTAQRRDRRWWEVWEELWEMVIGEVEGMVCRQDTPETAIKEVGQSCCLDDYEQRYDACVWRMTDDMDRGLTP